jgi:hypothetical protein
VKKKPYEHYYKVGELAAFEEMYKSDTSSWGIPPESLILVTNLNKGPENFCGRVVYPAGLMDKEHDFNMCHFKRVSMLPRSEDSRWYDLYYWYVRDFQYPTLET